MASVSLSVSPSGIRLDTAPKGGWGSGAVGGREGEIGRRSDGFCFGQVPHVSSGSGAIVDFGCGLCGAVVRTIPPRRGDRVR